MICENAVYKNGEISGEMNTYFENGGIFYKRDYNDGEGIMTSYYSNGNINSEGRYRQRKKEGIWKFYDKSGNLVVTEEYKNGIVQ